MSYKKGKYFLPPPADIRDVKGLFRFAYDHKVGCPATKDSKPRNGWTPKLFAEAFSALDPSGKTLDTRSVYNWLQDREKGIRKANLLTIAKVFGCDDPASVEQWRDAFLRALSSEELFNGAPSDRKVAAGVSPLSRKRFQLSAWSEKLFDSEVPYNLSIFVFCGAVCLGLFATSIGLDSVTYSLSDGTAKQVGFLWAPNWTIVFLVILPIYLAIIGNLVRFWKQTGRPNLSKLSGQSHQCLSWDDHIRTSELSFRVIFLASVVVVSGFNWVMSYLIPLITDNSGHLAVDWGRVAVERPDIVSSYAAIAFTAAVFFYMAACSFLFFVGLLLLLLVAFDFERITGNSEPPLKGVTLTGAREDVDHVVSSTFRCVILGLMITLLIRAQSDYLLSPASSILSWLAADFLSLANASGGNGVHYPSSLPAYSNSLISLIAICAVFFVSMYKLRSAHQTLLRNAESQPPSVQKPAVSWMLLVLLVLFFVCTYFLTGIVRGFSVMLVLCSIICIWALLDPSLAKPRKLDERTDNNS